MSSPVALRDRPDGFYWVRVAGKPTIAQHRLGYWQFFGSEHDATDEAAERGALEVLGPVTPLAEQAYPPERYHDARLLAYYRTAVPHGLPLSVGCPECGAEPRDPCR